MKSFKIPSFPVGAEANGFIAALSSAVLYCLHIPEEYSYWCKPKGSYCMQCGACGNLSVLSKLQEEIYHALLTVSGLAFTFDYPEDDSVPYHTMPNTPAGWRWPDSFVADILDFAGLSYTRYENKSVQEMRGRVKDIADCGFTALVSNHGPWQNETDWNRSWRVVCGYTDAGICIMHSGGEVVTECQGAYEDWILITGRTERRQTDRDLLKRIYQILTDPSHDKLEREIYDDLSHVTPENAIGLAYKMMEINGVPIETRWHAAEAFYPGDKLLFPLMKEEKIQKELGDLLFSRYIADNNNETHGTGWKIWNALQVGPDTNYLPAEESFALIQKPQVQRTLRDLYKIVFDNDRAVAKGIYKILEEI